MKNLDNPNIEMTKQEIGERIRQYYIEKYSSITKIEVTIIENYTQGQWNEAWQYNIGGDSYLDAKVEIIQEMTVFGEQRKFSNIDFLEQKDIENILSALLKADGWVVRNLISPGLNKNVWTAHCEKIGSEEEQSSQNNMRNWMRDAKRFIRKTKKSVFSTITSLWEAD